MDRWTALIIVVALLAAVFVVVEVATRARRAANRRFAESQPRTTLTVIGVRDKDILSTLARAQHEGRSLAKAPYVFIVTISSGGVTFWGAGRTPRELETFPTDRVLGIDLGTHTEKPEYRQPVLPRIKITVAPIHDPAGPPIDLQFGILKLTSGAYISRYLDEPAVQDVVRRARVALDGGDPSEASASPETSTFTSRPGTLEPGTTAFRASHVLGIPVSRIITWSSVIIAPIVLFAAFQQQLGVVLGVIVIDVAAVGALLWREGRAVTREKAAGYTTLNGHHLHLEQRHPLTGMVVREAGATAISAERFRELLDR